jgi:gliding motility-associated-like protein
LKKAFYIVVIPLLLIVSLKAYSQSNKGTEFWTAFLCHNNNTGGTNGRANMVLYITSDLSTTGSVEVGGVLLENFTVTANQVTFVDIPQTTHMATQGTFPTSGIHITSARPIAIYAHIYASNVSGATLLLPVNAMGKEYLSLNYTQVSNADQLVNPAFSTFAVIATEDNTTVSITPSALLLDGQTANAPFQINLNKGEVYQGLSETDLTGTKIQSVGNGSGTCKKIAVFSGSSRIGIGCSPNVRFSSDNLFQQVYPTSTWGKNYITVPLASRPYDVYRIVASEPNTTVKRNGTTISLSGLFYEFTSTSTNIISADKPIQVVQYSPTQNQTENCTTIVGDVGDPEMIYLSPIEQGLNHVTLYSTGLYNIRSSFVNIIIPSTAISSFTVDGKAYPNFNPVPGSATYSFAQIPVATGSHTINAGVPFNAIAYGFGNTESYGYAAGTNLQDLNTNVALQDPADIDNSLTLGCSDKTYKLQTTIPFQTTNIKWRIDGDLVLQQANPVEARQIVRDGKTLFVYEYPTPINFPAGTHVVIATVFNPVADVCGSDLDIENVFSITDPPGKDFIVAASNCLGDATVFKDNTVTTTSNVIKSWLWDFDDGTTSTEQNPSHTYAAARVGDYKVRLTVVDYSGCTTVSDFKTVHIIPRPVADFEPSVPNCTYKTISFTNKSTAAEGTITKWDWDFGDGKTTAEENPTHTYDLVKAYNVKLTVTTSNGCISDARTKILTINPKPVVDFILPDVCISDRNSEFTSTSTIADGTESEFQYSWDFGDVGSGARNTSQLKTATHTYSAVGDYTVKLTVTSKYGCDTSISKTFTVNGSDPRPKFHPQNVYNCSNDSVTFIDESRPDFGNVTRLRFYYDLVNQPNAYQEFDRTMLRSDKTYRISYPINNSGTAVSYSVKLVAFTGSSAGCSAETGVQQVYVNPNPVVELAIGDAEISGPLTFCQSDPAIKIKTTPNHSLTGKQEFKGPGITADGTFDPLMAGPGTHTITYKFIAADANTACEYNTSLQILVNPSAVVSLPATYTVLEGNRITLQPTISILGGEAVTYEWSPAAGLSSTNIANPVVFITNNVTYTLTIKSAASGCVTTAKTFVKVLKIPVIPNAFTPNGDGINDTWEIKYLNDYPNATVEILNRTGTRVFYSNGYSKAWDGRLSNTDLPMGTYYYIISPNSGRQPTAGYITIIR